MNDDPTTARDLLAKALHATVCDPSGDACSWLTDENGDPACLIEYTQPLADAILASPALDAIVAERVAALAEEVFDQLMRVEPRDFDSKTQRPEFAHERCKQPNCSLRPWGLGTVTREDPRYCPAHEALSEARVAFAAIADRGGAS